MVGIYFLGVRPVLRFRSAKGWLVRPCEVVSSGVKTTYDGQMRTDHLDVVYRYEVGGQAFTSGDYDLLIGSSTGCNDDRELVKRFPVGSTVECYVNPRDPRDAVLNRRLPPETATVAMPLILAAMAVLPFIVHRRRRGSEPGGVAGERGVPVQTLALSVDDLSAAPASATLTPHESRRSKGLALIVIVPLFATVWWLASRSLSGLAGSLLGPTTAFYVVQAALRVGLGVALARVPIRIALDMLTPRLALSLSPAVARFGEPARIEWRLVGRKARVSSLRFWVEGHEGRHEPKMKTDARLFHRQPLLDVTGAAVAEADEVRMIIPGPQPSWPPVERASWSVWVGVHAPPLPKVVTFYRIELAPHA